jgi:acetyl-CoA carboxylase biotin carboxyl carrier protein
MSEKKGSEEPMRIDTDLIRQLADLLTENDLSEIEVEDSERRIVVKRKLNVAAMPVYAAPVAPSSNTAAPAPAAPASTSVTTDNPGSHPGAVKSPMVGTAYLSAEPGAAPFAALGAQVNAGDTLLIIEAMKVMNPITAPKAGTVKRILIQDAQPVEFDQPLVIVE